MTLQNIFSFFCVLPFPVLALIVPIFIMVYTCIFNVLPDGVVSTTTSAGRALPGPGGGEGVTASPVGSHLGRSHPKTKG